MVGVVDPAWRQRSNSKRTAGGAIPSPASYLALSITLRSLYLHEIKNKNPHKHKNQQKNLPVISISVSLHECFILSSKIDPICPDFFFQAV